MRWVKTSWNRSLFISSSIPDCLGPYFSTWAPRLWPNLRDQICSAAQMVLNFLACWNYWILIRRVCDLSVGAASLQPSNENYQFNYKSAILFTNCPVGWLVWWLSYKLLVSGSRWLVKIKLEPVPQLLSRTENWNY
jgi:hypothetical protein